MLRPKPNIEQLAPATHGGIDYRELEKLGISPQDILDFSVSANPFGPPPGVAEALCRVSVTDYPDGEATELRRAFARKLSVGIDNIIIGSGSTELIRLAAMAYLGAGDTVLIPEPTYGDYKVACRLTDARILKQPVPAVSGFKMDITDVMALIKKHHPKAIFLCNPNNPTGQYLSREEVEQLLAAVNLLVLDEAYIAFTPDTWQSLDLVEFGNLIIVRSMTKDYALAGLRLGYAVAAEPVITTLKKVRPPWNVSAVAQRAGVLSLQADEWLRGCQQKIQEAKDYLMKELTALGLSPVPSYTNFFLVKVGGAAALRQSLLKKGMLVRDCTSFGLPEYIRLAPRSLRDCRRLITAMKEVRHAG